MGMGHLAHVRVPRVLSIGVQPSAWEDALDDEELEDRVAAYRVLVSRTLKRACAFHSEPITTRALACVVVAAEVPDSHLS